MGQPLHRLTCFIDTMTQHGSMGMPKLGAKIGLGGTVGLSRLGKCVGEARKVLYDQSIPFLLQIQQRLAVPSPPSQWTSQALREALLPALPWLFVLEVVRTA
jgi:hypothetical protein